MSSSIDRLAAQDATRTYLQNTDAARTGVQAAKANNHHLVQKQPVKSVDSVTLSDSARSLSTARDAVKNAPDVREQKVADIKRDVTNGTYNVPASVLARKMLSQSTHD